MTFRSRMLISPPPFFPFENFLVQNTKITGGSADNLSNTTNCTMQTTCREAKWGMQRKRKEPSRKHHRESFTINGPFRRDYIDEFSLRSLWLLGCTCSPGYCGGVTAVTVVELCTRTLYLWSSRGGGYRGGVDRAPHSGLIVLSLPSCDCNLIMSKTEINTRRSPS